MFLKAAIEVFKAAWAVLSEFGLSGVIIGGTSAFFMAGWASLSRQEPWYLLNSTQI